jgi:putative FmdB family regulatory protein
MPTYSYACDACGKSFEKEQRIIEDPIKTCELCGKPKARRLIVSGNFILKGGGWYSDGYGSKGKGSSSKASNEASSSSGSSSTSTSSSDTATKDTKATKDAAKPTSSKVEAAE